MNHIQKVRFPISAALLFAFSSLLAALIIYELTKGSEANVAAIIFFLILITAASSVGGVQTAAFVKAKLTLKYGEEAIGRLADYGGLGDNRRVRYYLVIAYTDNGVAKSYKTKASFYTDELRYLRRQLYFKIKFYKGFVVITVPFPDEIYKRTIRRR